MAIFDETATYYSRYREPYPLELFAFLIQSIKPLHNNDTVLDLGCGTGEMAIPLSRYFQQAVGVDPSLDMLHEAQKKSEALKCANITWLHKNAEEVMLEPASVQLITIAKAFHWMNQDVVLENAKQMLQQGGCFAVIGSPSLWNGNEEWQLKAKEIIQTFLGPERKVGNTSSVFNDSKKAYSEVLAEAFGNSKTKTFHSDLTWTLDSVLGYLYSTSFSKRELYGKRIAEFETALTDELKGAFQNPVHSSIETTVTFAFKKS